VIDVYWASGSCKSWSVLLALVVKRVPFASKLLEFSKGQHKTSEYLALNPRGKVPCIQDGDYVLFESSAILAYLDRKHPNPPLYGETPAECGLVTRLVSEARCYFEPTLDALVLPIYRGKAAEQAQDLVAKAGPVHEELATLESFLSKSDYLAGSRLSTADLVVFPLVQHLKRGVSRPAAQGLDLGFERIDERYPHLSAWGARIEQIRGYELTYPPHWK
jgi:glutathione S-transferase